MQRKGAVDYIRYFIYNRELYITTRRTRITNKQGGYIRMKKLNKTRKIKAGVPPLPQPKINKTRKQQLTEALPSDIFLKKRQGIEKNITKYEQLFETETQKDTPDPVQVKIYKDRVKKYQWELRTLLANQASENPPPLPENIPQPPLPPPLEQEIPHNPLPETPAQDPPQDIKVVEESTEEQQQAPEQEKQQEQEQNIPQPLPKESPSITEIEIEEPTLDASEKKINEYKQQMERQQAIEESKQPDSGFLYPTQNDPQFQSKIAKRKEFFDNQFLDEPTDVKRQSDLLCKAEFEHLPHQVFVRNFLSPQTPYRSLLLYHQLGTGKTCTAIGVCEEFRQTMKQIGTTKQQRIIIVGSVNVKANFRKQLFDEDKIRKIAQENRGHFDYEDIQLCTASALLKEINPMNLQGLPLDTVIQQVHTLIDQYYSFLGYQSLSNYINRYIQFKASDLQKKEYTEEYLKQRRIDKIRQHFNGRLFVIDEAHNLRVTSDNGDENSKKTSMLLLEIAQYAENVRLLLLTATPMYNSPEEVLWWTNLLNTNDRRSTISRSEVFTAAATNNEDTVEIFKPKEETKLKIEGGRELLQRKLIGYVSYVRGENPFTFPYRIYPTQFLTDAAELRAHTFDDTNRPLIQMNGKPIPIPLQHIPVFLTQLDRESYQYILYDLCIKYLKQHTFTQKDKFGNQTERKGFEEMGGFGYTLLQIPIECLNIVFPSTAKSVLTSEAVQGGALPMVVDDIPGNSNANPNPTLNNLPTAPSQPTEYTPEDLEDPEDDDEDYEPDEETPEAQEEDPQLETPDTEDSTPIEDENPEGEQAAKRAKILRDDPEWIKKKNFLTNSIGEKGIRNTMAWKTPKTGPHNQNTQYEYKSEIFQSFGRFLSPENLPQYSRKFAEIQQRILRSTGVVMVYSEYINGGVVPFALALEELGFERHVPVNSRFTNTLFNPQSQNFAKISKRDATTMRSRSDPLFQSSSASFKQAKYALITGNSAFSPNNAADINLIISPENKLGELVKVVLITRAASEGVDFKFLRQIHILEPWYNMNRIEQIIGRGVRNSSHCMLPWEERNVEIYLHGTLLPGSTPPLLEETTVEISSQDMNPLPLPETDVEVSPQDTIPQPPEMETTEEVSPQNTFTEKEETALEVSPQDMNPQPLPITETSLEVSPQDTIQQSEEKQQEMETGIGLSTAQAQQPPPILKGGADDLQPPPPSEEAADIYIYRLAERKAKKIGQITRLLKETAVDCVLNIRQTKFTIQDLEAVAANQNLTLTLSTDQKQIAYKVGDKPFTDICDYMDNCAFQCMDTTKITDAELTTQTYQYSNVKANRPMIMKRIRQLFREDMVYTNKQLIQLIQGSKEYPEVQIYDTLSYFLQNDNETLIDKYGRLGRLTNHGKYYAFLPLELQDTRASLFERSRPIDYKHTYLRFEPSSYSSEAPISTQNQPIAPPSNKLSLKPISEMETEMETAPAAYEQNNIQQVFEQSMQKVSNWIAYSSMTNPLQTSEEDKVIKNWFRSVPSAKNILQYLFTTYPPTIPLPTEEDYLQYSLFHAMDLLSTDEKLAIAYVVFSPPKETEDFVNEQDRTTPIFQAMAAYFKSRFIQGKETQSALVLANFDFKTNQSSNQFWSMTLEPTEDEIQPKQLGWYPVSETDIPVFFQQAFETQFQVPSSQIHYKFGFMRPFLSKSKIQTGEIVLNIKNFNQKTRNNKGARVDQALKQDLKIHLQNILGISTIIEFPPAVEKLATVVGLSVALEFLLRWKDRKPNLSGNQLSTAIAKKYFFTLEESIANKTEALFCRVDGALNVISCEP